ncbi:MAG: hypothetical protein KGQ59_00605, partial [Bdellovibrionales bacterium]|nr:hypothetical protein [Bdellovibrionales bacterium]
LKTSADVVNLVKAILANHLALHESDLGKVGRQLEQITGSDPFGGEMKKYVAFQTIKKVA